MNYKEYTYEKCSKCENEVLIENSSFCNICCFDLRNLCSNTNCENRNGPSLPKNSRYCHLCGHKTTYLISDLLTDWDLEVAEDSSEKSEASSISSDNSNLNTSSRINNFNSDNTF